MALTFLLEPVIIMSPEDITVILSTSQIKYISVLPIPPIFGNLYSPKLNLGFYEFQKMDRIGSMYRNVFDLGTVKTNRHLCRTHLL